MSKFSKSLTNAQVSLARRFEAAGLTSYSQAVKAFEHGDDERIAAWKAELSKRSGK